MNPATVFSITPTSVPEGINASTQTEIPPSESLQALTKEYIRYNDEIVKNATDIAERYRDLFVSNQNDRRTISSLQEKNRELFEHNVTIFASHEALLASHHRDSSEIARSADGDDLLPPRPTDTSGLRSDYKTRSVNSRTVQRNPLSKVEAPIRSRAL
jgi:hypothetical protein